MSLLLYLFLNRPWHIYGERSGIIPEEVNRAMKKTQKPARKNLRLPNTPPSVHQYQRYEPELNSPIQILQENNQ